MLTLVTITGADDKTDPDDMVALSGEFPFVEWGILCSPKRTGTNRFPSSGWIASLPSSIRLSMHLCGAAARDVLAGGSVAKYSCGRAFDRYQLNGYTPPACDDFTSMCSTHQYRWILQARNESSLALAVADALKFGDKADILFDPSGGRGIETAKWPPIPSGVRLGFAGGIRPSNVARVLAGIGHTKSPFWIDMESGVRTDEDELDLGLVRQVLEVCKSFVTCPARDREARLK